MWLLGDNALCIPTIGKRRPGRPPRSSYLTYIQRVLGDNEGVVMQEQQIAALAGDRRAWRNLVVACYTADGWWWWWCLWFLLQRACIDFDLETLEVTIWPCEKSLLYHIWFLSFLLQCLLNTPSKMYVRDLDWRSLHVCAMKENVFVPVL